MRLWPLSRCVLIDRDPLEPRQTLTRHLTGAAPAPGGATLELADQWGRLEPIAVEGVR